MLLHAVYDDHDARWRTRYCAVSSHIPVSCAGHTGLVQIISRARNAQKVFSGTETRSQAVVSVAVLPKSHVMRRRVKRAQTDYLRQRCASLHVRADRGALRETGGADLQTGRVARS